MLHKPDLAHREIKAVTDLSYISTFAANVLIQACTLIQGMLLARLLGPEGRGQFAVITLWPSVFAGIGILGINTAIARLSGQGHATKQLAKTAFYCSLITSGFSALLCSLAMPFLIPHEKHNLLPAAYIFLLFIPLNHVVLNFMGIDHGRGDFLSLNAARIIIYPVFFLGAVLCWLYASDKVQGITMALVAANFVVFFICLTAKSAALLDPSEPGYGITQLFKASTPYILANKATVLFSQADKALLTWLLSPRQIGWYVAAFAAAGTVNALNNALGLIQFSNSAQSGQGKGFLQLAIVLRRGAIFSIIAAALLVASFPWLMPLIYGADFGDAVSTSRILIIGFIIAGKAEIIDQAFRGQGRPLTSVIVKLLGLGITALIATNFAITEGANAIAYGFLSGQIVVLACLLIMAIRHYEDARISSLMPRWDDIAFILVRFKRKANIGI